MILHKNISIILPDNNIAYCNVEEHTRGGTKSPVQCIILYKNKRYPPYAQQHFGFYFSLNSLFKLTYGNLIEQMIYSDNKFLSLIKKVDYDMFKGNYIKPISFGD